VEYRKIIKFGNSSHVVSLPNTWMKRNNLSKGDTVFFEQNGNDELVFSSKNSEKIEVSKEITIDGKDKSIEYIIRELVSSYMNNYNTIKIIDKNLDKKAVEIRTVIHQLMGLEIVEQSSTKIVAKDFLNLEGLSLYGIIRRADTIIKNMLENSGRCLKEDHCISITDSDSDVNRIYYVIGKLTRNALDNPQLTKKMNITYAEIVHISRIIASLEGFADEVKRVARSFKNLKLKKKESEELIKIYDEIVSMYSDSMKSFYNKDKDLAYIVLDKRRPILKRIDDFMDINRDPITVRIVEKLKTMVTNLKHISRISIDISIDEHVNTTHP
jgi:phosphate transport system protein